MMTSCECSPGAGNDTCNLGTATSPAACPTNGQVGKPVELLTLKALMAIPLTELRFTEYRFCREAACPTVYYSVDGMQCFTEGAVRELVYQKHPADDDVFVCYCFRHTIGSIRAELLEKGSTTIIESITAGIQDGQCACEIRNPQGSCCLGNVRAVVQGLTSSVAAANASCRS